MSTQDIVYRYEGPDLFWGLPDRDLTQEDLDTFTPTQLRELRAAKAYTEVEAIDLTKLNRDDLNSYAINHGIAEPSQFSTKELLIAAIAEGPTNTEPPVQDPPVDPPELEELANEEDHDPEGDE